ncbi:MAG TPA: hypothetical protein VKQ06_12425 [Gammaproteobacteria bacterium]|nr:hypothetical protein [Gammaproteobacteria bacterium]
MGARRIAALIALVSPWLVSTSAVAQSDIPRTPWGHPDLQGVWDYRTITPLQRPEEFGDRAFYTEEEIAALEENAADRYDEPPDTSVQTGLVHAIYLTDPGTNVDASRRNSLIVDPPNGRIPELTAQAQAARERQAQERERFNEHGPSDMSRPWLDRPLYERCIARGFPQAIMPTLYNNNIEIVQAPDHVAIVHEMIHETRVVPLDGREYSGIAGFMGESRGHWEGDTLVIETRNFNGQTPYRGSTENLVVTERFTRTGPDSIEFSMTLQDDQAWARPWTVAYQMRPTDGYLYEYACHEGNRGLENILENIYDAADAAATGSGD